jgi:sulfate permease, SulP family
MFGWLAGYRKDWLRPDVLAGLITAAVVIPKALANASIAGLPVQVGLYTALVPMVVYAALGSPRVLSVTTTTTIAILTGAELTRVVPSATPNLRADSRSPRGVSLGPTDGPLNVILGVDAPMPEPTRGRKS